jgi:PII-like signaling protein
MRTERDGTRVVVFLTEDDRAGHHGLYQVILDRALADGIAGATLSRGIEGFGSSGNIRTNRFPDSTTGLPLLLELVDSPERIEAFLPVLAELAPRSLVTREPVRMSRIMPKG